MSPPLPQQPHNPNECSCCTRVHSLMTDVRDEVREQRKYLASLDKAIRGPENKPHLGLLTRVYDMERRAKLIGKVAIAAAMIALGLAVDWVRSKITGAH